MQHNSKYGLIGNPARHSLSPAIYQAFQKQTGIAFDYVLLEPAEETETEALRRFQREGGRGLNVTSPFKQWAYALSSEQSEAAKIAGAASVLTFLENGNISAENYDGLGLYRDLSYNHHFDLYKKKILILGAGGAVRGILEPLLQGNPSQIVIANRTSEKAEELAKAFYSTQCELLGVGLPALKVSKPYDLVIHATRIGHDRELLALPLGPIGSKTLCYDLSYGKAALPFLQLAKAQGAKVYSDGLGMLVEHNAAVFKKWFDIYPETDSVIREISSFSSHQ